MNTSRLTTLSWDKLISKDMIGEEILISYADIPRGNSKFSINVINVDTVVTIVGTAYVGNDHILLVYDKYIDGIYIIKRDLKGDIWDAYKII